MSMRITIAGRSPFKVGDIMNAGGPVTYLVLHANGHELDVVPAVRWRVWAVRLAVHLLRLAGAP